MHSDLSISIVLNKSDRFKLRQTLESVRSCSMRYKLFLIDNSPTRDLEKEIGDIDAEYIFNNKNCGFGRGHNIAIKKSVQESKYHLVLNPDVSFPANTLETLFAFMEQHPDIGLVLPKVYNYESQEQYLARRLPHPLDLVIRRIDNSFFSNLFRQRLVRYEMREKNHEKMFEAPFLSGCFMFLRCAALKKVGFFDERFFLYMEDVDLSRRMYKYYKNMYLPTVSIYHAHSRGSYNKFSLLAVHIQSAIQYFTKWGWILDSERRKINASL